MTSDQRPFYVALLVSVIGHLAMLTGGVPWWSVRRTPSAPVEVTYVMPRVLDAPPARTSMPRPPIPRPKITTPPLARSERPAGSSPMTADRPRLALPVKPPASAAAVASARSPATKPIDLDIVPATSPSLAKEPTFQLYYRAIRERIRAKAYQAVPRPFQRGEVRLSFVVMRQGELVALQLDDRSSSPLEVLRHAALRAVREAAPFPPFPPVVTQAQIAFTIVISFEEEPLR